MGLNLTYMPQDFGRPEYADSPFVRLQPAPADGIAPPNFQATSNFPKYVQLYDQGWTLVPESRMDAVLRMTGKLLEVVEARRLKKSDMVVIGRTENGEE